MIEKQDIQFTERFRRGYDNVEGFDGPNMWRLHGQYESFPDQARLIAEYVFGDIYLRDHIDMKLRKIIIMGALMAKGTTPRPLTSQMQAYLENGGTIDDLREMVLICQAFTGVPNSSNSMACLRDLIAEVEKNGEKVDPPAGIYEPDLGGKTRFEYGHDYLKEFGGKYAKDLVDVMKENYHDLFQYYQEFLVSDILARTKLDTRSKDFFLIALLTSMDAEPIMFKMHINLAMKDGVTVEDINEIAIVLSGYIGFSNAVKLAKLTNEVLKGE